MAVSTSSSRSAAVPLIKELRAPGRGMSETLPSAPAVVLPSRGGAIAESG